MRGAAAIHAGRSTSASLGARHYGQGTPEALAFALPHHRSGSSVCIKTGMAKTARETDQRELQC